MKEAPSLLNFFSTKLRPVFVYIVIYYGSSKYTTNANDIT